MNTDFFPQSLSETTGKTKVALHCRKNLIETVRTCWRRLRCLSSPHPRRLFLRESLSLGDRRFVSVVEFERFRFLVGSTSTSLVLLARLDGAGGGSVDDRSPGQEER